jgi:KDO2-lipid IV(A) lauroyltransferase
MKEKIEYYSVKTLIFIIGLLPNQAIYKSLQFIAKVIYKYEKRRSSLTRKNIQTVFPNLSEDEVEKLAKKSYESVAITLAEIILMLNGKLNLDDMVSNRDEFLEQMQKYTKDIKNGAVIITAHFSNWELAAQFLPKHGYKMTAVGREGNNKLIEKNITTPFRQRYGNKNIYKKNAMISIIKALRKNKIVGLLIDQKAGGKNSLKLKFFGLPADTINSVAMLKLKYNPLILPIFAIREKSGKYRIEIKEPVEYVADEELNEDKKIEKISQKHNDILEDVIREYPEQWFWMHNRWRLV